MQPESVLPVDTPDDDGIGTPERFAAHARALLIRLTLAEKVALCSGRDFWTLTGVPRLGLPGVPIADGPHGLHQQVDVDAITLTDTVPATCFPTASALASSWDRDLLRAVGTAIGTEARAAGVGVVLGPGINIKRSPLGGRNFEYFSEDPYLSGALATAYIQGVQGVGVGAAVKHFAANNQETRRFVIDAIIDERALREIYLAGFEQAVREGRPWIVMAAYNLLNGTHCTEDRHLLGTILRDDWGYDGVVVSDWGAANRRVPALAAGLDIEMPGVGGVHDPEIIRALRDGHLPVAALDRAAGRILALLGKATSAAASPLPGDRCAHHALARRAAAAGAVLLQNTGRTLPLAPEQAIAVVGAFAKVPRYQGTGSSRVTPTRLDTAYDAIAARVDPGVALTYAAGYEPETGATTPALLAEARRAAGGVDVVVVFVGLLDAAESEGRDREHPDLPPGHDALIAAVAAAHSRVVVVLCNGAPVAMPWHGQVGAILEAYLGGQAGGDASAQLLYGEINPSGKLAETFPLRLEDHPAHAFFPGGPRTVEYRESIYVGYRYFDTAHKAVLFPFGHGLSYTTFAYRDLHLSAPAIRDTDPLTVTVTVTNTGPVSGEEVVQLYVHDVASTVFRPVQELKGFAKIWLRPGASTPVTFTLDRRAFAYYDVGRRDWHVEAGQFELRVGASSRDIRCTVTVEIDVPGGPFAADPSGAPLSTYGDLAGHELFDRDAFAALYGQPLPSNLPARPGRYTADTPLGDMRESPVVWLLRAAMRRGAAAATKGESNRPAVALVVGELPPRVMLAFGRGVVTPILLDGLVLLANGRWRSGLRALARANLQQCPVRSRCPGAGRDSVAGAPLGPLRNAPRRNRVSNGPVQTWAASRSGGSMGWRRHVTLIAGVLLGCWAAWGSPWLASRVVSLVCREYLLVRPPPASPRWRESRKREGENEGEKQ